MSDNNQLRYLRLYQIIGCRKRGIQPIIPVGPTTWWNGVKSGKFPKPTKLTVAAIRRGETWLNCTYPRRLPHNSNVRHTENIWQALMLMD